MFCGIWCKKGIGSLSKYISGRFLVSQFKMAYGISDAVSREKNINLESMK